MDTWIILKKELSYYGIRVISGKRCQTYKADGSLKTQGIVRLIQRIGKQIEEQKKLLLFLWKEIVKLLQEKNENPDLILDTKLVDLFIFSLQDFSKFLLCFDETENSIFSKIIDSALNRDIKTFTSFQISKLSDYKISVDWIHRTISRLLYIRKMLAYALIGQKKIIGKKLKVIKVAKGGAGISGPWAHLDLPMEERVYPFRSEEDNVMGRSKEKKRQRRYVKNLQTYNSEGNVAEGHYWRELRNEPYSWYDRKSEEPYPHRYLLNY